MNTGLDYWTLCFCFFLHSNSFHCGIETAYLIINLLSPGLFDLHFLSKKGGNQVHRYKYSPL